MDAALLLPRLIGLYLGLGQTEFGEADAKFVAQGLDDRSPRHAAEIAPHFVEDFLGMLRTEIARRIAEDLLVEHLDDALVDEVDLQAVGEVPPHDEVDQ